jgi:hypothetical protein
MRAGTGGREGVQEAYVYWLLKFEVDLVASYNELRSQAIYLIL